MQTNKVTFRCSPHLEAEARKRAAREGVPLSVALRSFLLDYSHGRRPTVQVARAFEQLGKEVRAIGVNLNQATRALNTGNYPDDLATIVTRLAAEYQQLAENLDAYALPRQP